MILTKRQKALKKFRDLLKKYKRNPEYVDENVYLFTEQEIIFIYEELKKRQKKMRLGNER